MRVAVLGTGKMGAAAARRLAGQGFQLHLWNRTRERAEALALGEVFETPEDAVAEVDVALSILTGPDAVRNVYARLDARGERVYLEMSTAGPEVPEELGRRFHRLVAAPVVAPPPMLEAGKALFLVGGPTEAIEQAQPVLEALGQVRSVGTYRRAAAMKLLNNTMLAITSAAGAEMVEAGVRAGLTREEAFEWVVRHAPYLDMRKVGLPGRAVRAGHLRPQGHAEGRRPRPGPVRRPGLPDADRGCGTAGVREVVEQTMARKS